MILPMDDKAKVVEIYKTIQGEGKYVGLHQFFLRLSMCNMACAYCDTDFEKGTWMGRQEVLTAIEELREKNPDTKSVSITGGEPLLQEAFLRRLLPDLRDMGLQCLLETNGTLPRELQGLLPWIDIVSMDIKLPGVSSTKPFWDRHAEFLGLCDGKDVYVKVVVADSTPTGELQRAIDLVAGKDKGLCFVLQPVTPMGGVRSPASWQMDAWAAQARRSLRDVRVIGQMHREWAIP